MSLKNTLKKLESKKDTVKIKNATGEEISLEMRGLSFPELAEVSRYADNDDGVGASNYILERAIVGAFEVAGEEYTKEDISNFMSSLHGRASAQIIRAVRDLSGLDEEAVEELGGQKND